LKNLCVMKFGGTCLASDEDRERSAALCITELEQCERAVVVVSAMGRMGDPYATDTLLGMVSSPEPEEKACLLACGEVLAASVFADVLRSKGVSAQALTGWNAGLRTDDEDCGATLEKVERDFIVNSLESNECVVIAGFQGMNSRGRISTLGRGGSDITATAIAAALNADQLILFKKVDSVYTADPRMVPSAVKVSRISSEDLRQMAWQGAKIVHPRASEIAGDAGVRITVKSQETGNRVTEIEPFVIRSGRYITGVASGPDAAQFIICRSDAEELHDFYARAFGMVADAGVSMDMFSVFAERAMFTVPLEDRETVEKTLTAGGIEHSVVHPCSKVSIVGAGMHGMQGVMARFSRALHTAGINMLQTVDSHATISALVPLDSRDEALKALHREFLE
jgi:aspartate kinase